MISLNIGILGHVDCGKTTLTQKLAEMGSTMAFDKHADNGGRRNTLDLGFSSLKIDNYRLALIDCPGHSALIRAVLAASQVFDLAIIVIDAMSGVQAQTAEHLLLCSMFCPKRVVVVLNKIDLIENSEKLIKIEKMKKNVRKALKIVGVDENCEIVEMSLNEQHFVPESIEKLKKSIIEKCFVPSREINKPFLMASDHCFSIKGKGTVVTGTVIQGSIRVGDEIEFAKIKEVRKVKSVESWKEKVKIVKAGERAALLVAQFDENRFSRCIVSSPGYLQPISQCLAEIEPITFFRSKLSSKTKMHISIGFETVMAECQFLRQTKNEFEQLAIMEMPCLVWLIFEKLIYLENREESQQVLMASRLEQNGKGCRFAFRGKVSKILENSEQIVRFSRKCRTGIIERVENDDGQSAICTGMFKPETNIEMFRNMKICAEDGGVSGRIEGGFGKNGKFRAIFDGKVREKMRIDLFMRKYLNDGSIKSYIPDSEELMKNKCEK